MINTQETSQITKIYLVTNCFGDPNKVYIGQTRLNRKSSHKKTFGKDITYDYIDEINSINKNDWKPLETFWINYFKFLGFDIQNENEGGAGPIFLSNESKQLISKNRVGKGLKPILQYDLDGNFIKEWESIKQINKDFLFKDGSSISGCCSNKHLYSYGFVWRYKKDKIQQFIKIPKRIHHKSIAVLQYDLEGNFIKEWESLTKASSFYKIDPCYISRVCRGQSKKSINFIWKFKNNE